MTSDTGLYARLSSRDHADHRSLNRAPVSIAKICQVRWSLPERHVVVWRYIVLTSHQVACCYLGARVHEKGSLLQERPVIQRLACGDGVSTDLEHD